MELPPTTQRALEVLERIRLAVPRPAGSVTDPLSTKTSMKRGTPARER